MARYIDADKFTERTKASPAFRNIYDGLLLQRVVIDLLNNIPTADVVPKSEADEIAEELSDTIVMKDELFDEVVRLRKVLEAYEETSGLKKAKAELAREIFEELARKSTYVFPTMLYTIAKRDVDELKNKYTEEKE